jgi:hypothetical protein
VPWPVPDPHCTSCDDSIPGEGRSRPRLATGRAPAACTAEVCGTAPHTSGAERHGPCAVRTAENPGRSRQPATSTLRAVYGRSPWFHRSLPGWSIRYHRYARQGCPDRETHQRSAKAGLIGQSLRDCPVSRPGGTPLPRAPQADPQTCGLPCGTIGQTRQPWAQVAVRRAMRPAAVTPREDRR